VTRRYIAWYPLGLITLLAVLSFWLEYTVQSAAVVEHKRERNDPDFTVDGLSALQSGPDGAPRYMLSASRMLHYPDDDSTHLADPRFRLLEPGKPSLSVRANRGLVSSEGQHLYLFDNVVLVRESPDAGGGPLTLTTSSLHVIPDKDFAETRDPVTLSDARTTIEGVGLELDARTRVLKLLSEVRGRYDPQRN